MLNYHSVVRLILLVLRDFHIEITVLVVLEMDFVNQSISSGSGILIIIDFSVQPKVYL